jgi:putative membrane protein
MTDGESLDHSIKKAHRHYNSLFFLPSFKKALVGVALMCLLAGLTSMVVLSTSQGIVVGLLVGAIAFALNFLIDITLSKVVLHDPVFVLRRTVVLSFFGWIFWIAFILLGTALGLAIGSIWYIRLLLLGFATIVTLRTVVFFSVVDASFIKRLAAVLLQPFFCVVPFAVFLVAANVSLLSFVPFLAVSPIIAFVAAFLFIQALDSIGKRKYGIASITIFKAFMLNWVAALNAPLESFLEKKGEDADVQVCILKFDSKKPNAAFVMPLVHPGPFKNIGSSVLPSLLKQEYDKTFACNACVPLGLLGHELDVASQANNQKIINAVTATATFEAAIGTASQLIRVSEGFVSTSCQAFGKTAFLSFTLAPKTTEDLPAELGDIVQQEAAKVGFESVVVVNAHNSITSNPNIEATLDELRTVATKCLQQTAQQRQYAFEVGSTTVHPSEFSLRDGMGEGGITAIVLHVAGQKIAYVIIDGNNMVSGLREKIVAALSSAGFPSGDVFTTDTHAVSAVVVGKRGYHPVGEAIDQEQLIKIIVDLARKADSNIEPCKAGYLSLVVPQVRVIGAEFLESITDLVDMTIQKAKSLLVPAFGLEGLLLLLLLFLF